MVLGKVLNRICEVCYGGCHLYGDPGDSGAVDWDCCDVICCRRCHDMGLPELHWTEDEVP